MVFDSIRGTPQTDGVPYCTAKAVPAAEGSLFNLASPPFFDPIPVLYGEAFVAVVVLTVQGTITTQTTYVVMQVDMGDGVWIDAAWCTWSGITGSATFVLSAGVAGANSFQQSRASGTAPSPILGSQQFPLAGRVRFVGKSTVNPSAGSSSASSGAAANAVLATIRYKNLGLR